MKTEKLIRPQWIHEPAKRKLVLKCFTHTDSACGFLCVFSHVVSATTVVHTKVIKIPTNAFPCSWFLATLAVWLCGWQCWSVGRFTALVQTEIAIGWTAMHFVQTFMVYRRWSLLTLVILCLTFPPAPPWGWHLYFWVKYLNLMESHKIWYTHSSSPKDEL